jgi:hypothetical protein
MVNTAFGTAKVIERVDVKQEAEGKSFTTLVELLETDDGESLVRVAYTTDGQARRGPVTVRKADLRRLAKALAKTSRLKTVIETEVATGQSSAAARARSASR